MKVHRFHSVSEVNDFMEKNKDKDLEFKPLAAEGKILLYFVIERDKKEEKFYKTTEA